MGVSVCRKKQVEPKGKLVPTISAIAILTLILATSGCAALGEGALVESTALRIAVPEAIAARVVVEEIAAVRVATAARIGSIAALDEASLIIAGRTSGLTGVFEELTTARSLSRTGLEIYNGRIYSGSQMVLTANDAGFIRLSSGEAVGRVSVRDGAIFDVAGTQIGQVRAQMGAGTAAARASMEVYRIRNGWYEVSLASHSLGEVNPAILSLTLASVKNRRRELTNEELQQRVRRLVTAIDSYLADK